LSRLPSNRSSSAAASGRSAPAASRRPGVLVQSPKSDIYVAMLGISLGAIIIACILMTLIFSKYNFSTKVSGLAAPSRTATLV
jgi:hypothetical protein